jgi:hypothetical protein
MGPRLIILLFLAIGLAVFFGLRASRPAQILEELEAAENDDYSPEEMATIRAEGRPLRSFPLHCETPPEPPQLSLRWEVPAGERQVIHFYIDEAHGYYVETFDLEFTFKPTNAATPSGNRLTVRHHFDNYLKANSTLNGCVFVVDAELKAVGGQMGSTEDWEGRIADYGRYCSENPEILRPRSSVDGCD